VTLNPLEQLPVFLAYSLYLEQESAERLRELADIMLQHNRQELHGLLVKLAFYSEQHADEVQTICGDTPLPKLHPWEYEWPDLESPETAAFDSLGYETTTRELLELALELEQKAATFYADIANRSTNKDVADHAREFAAEEREHAAALQVWLDKLPPESADRSIDIDPPSEPE
jgi:bacterioferritin (cytochrome b1)